MGTFSVSGIAEKDGATLGKKWPLKNGDVFDTSAERKYEVEVLTPLRAADGTRPAVHLTPDLEKQLVNVSIVLR